LQSSSLLRFRLVAVVVLFWPGLAAAQAAQGDGRPAEATPAEPSPVLVPSPAPATSSAPVPADSSSDVALRQDVEGLRAEVRALRTPIDSAPPVVAPPPPPLLRPRPLGYEYFWPWVLPPDGISFGAYLQSQYTSSQSSQDQLLQGGALINKNRFLIRRARVSLIGDWEYAAIAVEIDANTNSGPQVDLRKAEASLQYRPDRSKPPIVMATVGQFDTPFGYELVESPRTRWFMERSQASLAFWPGEPDLGVRLAGALGFFRWTIAAVNGEPLGEATPYVLQDPNSAKDVIFRFGADSAPRSDFQIAGGVSALRGTGFHPGTDATKSGVQWQDANDNGLIDSSELQPIPAQNATPSQNFQRWAVGADLRLNYRWALGVAKAYGEFTLASNMDRGLYVADPIVSTLDQRELGYVVGVTQEILGYGVVGLRYDYYDPNSNAFDNRLGRLIPSSSAIKTWSPLVGLVLPDRARLLFQYDVVHNNLARNTVGVPTNFPANAWTVRLQVQL
jgi:hypothetical protein